MGCSPSRVLAQDCSRCDRLRRHYGLPNTRRGDGTRIQSQLSELIQTAKDTGDWPGAADQWGKTHQGPYKATVFWDSPHMRPMTGQGVRFQMCLEALKVTPAAFSGNPLMNLPGLDLCHAQSPDTLHVLDIGIFTHLIDATIQLFRDIVGRWVDKDGKPITTTKEWNSLMKDLSRRLFSFGTLTHELHLTHWLSRAFERADLQLTGEKNSTPTFTGPEARVLTVALPVALQGLLDNVLDKIRCYYHNNPSVLTDIQHNDAAQSQAEAERLARRHQPGGQNAAPTDDEVAWRKEFSSNASRGPAEHCGAGAVSEAAFEAMEEARRNTLSVKAHLRRYVEPEDPTPELQEIWLMYASITLDVRAAQTDSSRLPTLRASIAAFKHRVMEVFPYKSGQWAAWAFIKMHELDHLVSLIVEFGSCHPASASNGERSHQIHVKQDCAQSNRHVDQFASTVMVRNAGHILAKGVLQSRRGTKGFFATYAGSMLQSRDAGAVAHSARKAWRSKGIKFPLSCLYDHHLQTQRHFCVPGGDRVRTGALSNNKQAPFEILLAMLPAYAGEGGNPLFKHLEQMLSLWIWRMIMPAHSEGDMPGREHPTKAQLQDVIQKYLPSGSITLWNLLEIENKAAPGLVCRVRTDPFPDRTFHGHVRQACPPPPTPCPHQLPRRCTFATHSSQNQPRFIVCIVFIFRMVSSGV